MLLKTDELGVPRFTNRDLINLIYSGNIEKCHVVLCDPSDDVDRFNAAMEEQGLLKLQKYIPIDVDQKTFDGVCQSEWFMPDKYKNITDKMLWGWLLDRCSKDSEYDRVKEEFFAYKERGMLDLLRYMIYLVSFMRENNIVWGVGRGSSVASYVLYLIGVHKIDSLKYNLDWREFLRD
jgi:DNA polymerase III alpha subunit